jgi:hypothetical protein
VGRFVLDFGSVLFETGRVAFGATQELGVAHLRNIALAIIMLNVLGKPFEGFLIQSESGFLHFWVLL